MTKHQIITTEGGEELVVLPRAAFDDLVARAEAADLDEAPEFPEELEALARRGARLVAEAAGETPIPMEAVRAMNRGENPVRAIRRARGLTRAQLAAAAGVSRPAVAEIERSTKNGSPETLRALAVTLGTTTEAFED